MRTDDQVRELVERGLEFPPFVLRIRRDVDWGDTPEGRRPDWVFNISFEGASFDFGAQYTSSAGLKNLRLALMEAQSSAYFNKARGIEPLVVVPYLNPEALNELVAQKTSGIDLCGNGVLYARNWFAYRTGAKNKFPSSAPVKSPYRGEQSMVTRALLSRREFKTQQEIVDNLKVFNVAASTVSKVLAVLEEELMAEKKPAIRALRPGALLDALRENYRAPKITSTRRMRRVTQDDVYKRLADNAQRAGVLYAVSSPERYAVLPGSRDVMRVFTNDAKSLLAGIDLEENDRFPELEIQEIESKLPFFGRESENGRWWTSPLQEYLELSSGGKREQEAAVSIRARILSATGPA